MNPIQLDIGGFITCSLDKRVRLWSPYLDLWGTIDQCQERIDPKWAFPMEAKRQQKEVEIGQVKELLHEVENVDSEKNLLFHDQREEDDGSQERGNNKDDIPNKLISKKKKNPSVATKDLDKTTTNTERSVANENSSVMNRSVIDNLDRKIAEFELKTKIMQLDFPR